MESGIYENKSMSNTYYVFRLTVAPNRKTGKKMRNEREGRKIIDCSRYVQFKGAAKSRTSFRKRKKSFSVGGI